MLVIIPAYQPDEKLKRVVLSLREKTNYPILIVDDGSCDACQPLFTDLESYATVLHHAQNMGKGRAMKTAFAYAYEHFRDEGGLITVDADGQHLTEDIIRVCDAWEKNPGALVLGSRKFTGNVPKKSMFGNTVTRLVFSVATGVKVYDTQTGLRAFAINAIPKMMELKGERYEYEINQLLYCTRNHIPIDEVTIETVYIEENKSSHFHPFRDSWRVYKIILLFVSTSLFCFGFEWILFTLLGVAITHLRGSAMLLVNDAVALLMQTIVARVCSALLNYSLNRRVVFQSRNRTSLARYILVASMIYGINYGLLYVQTVLLAMPDWISFVIAQLICYPLSFLLQRMFVFCKDKKHCESIAPASKED